MKGLLLFFFTTLGFLVSAQSPQVPHKLRFAGMTLTIRDEARKEIQADVDALTRSPRHYHEKAERARMYFPIIEKVFEEENLPDDFKYLVLQESALIPDAVSVSNAVGFWQFKDFTALEMGLRVDKVIDERMNIVSSTRAAARYLKKNNYYFNNWIYALQAYQMGAGGVMRSVSDTKSGASHMEISSKTYWYVKKYLAHKIAFEPHSEGPSPIRLSVYENTSKRSLEDWAREFELPSDEIRSYNKWVRGHSIPDDRTYSVVRPVANPDAEVYLATNSGLPSPGGVAVSGAIGKAGTSSEMKRINGILVLKAMPGDKAVTLAERAHIELADFLRYNDISINEPIHPGHYYFVKKKHGRAREAYHTVAASETLWSISQQYGMQLKRLKKFNRINSDRELQVGMTLWLTGKRPRADQAMGKAPVVEVDNTETFAWTIGAPAVELEKPVVGDKGEEQISVPQVDAPKQDSVQLEGSTIPAAQVPEEEPASIPETHTVLAGETLYALSKRYKLAVTDLAYWNNLDLKQPIQPGQVLRLKGPAAVVDTVSAEVSPTSPQAPQYVIHEVQSSDTLYSIARKYGVTIKDLMDWNNKKDFAIAAGEKLKIKKE